MAEDDDKSSRTEAATDKKLSDARKKGDVPSSRETGNLMSIFSLFVLVIFMLPGISQRVMVSLSTLIDTAGQIDIGTGSGGLADMGRVIGTLARSLGLSVAPIFGMMILAALFAVLIQGETVVATERLKPELSKISPKAGFGRVYSVSALVEFGKSMLKVLAVGALALWIARRAITGIWQGENLLPEALPAYLRHFAGLLLILATSFMLPVALGDILWKRFSWLRRQRMSLKDIRDEHKDSEGDPQIKMRRTVIRRRRARQRITTAVPTATVILTNPTHYAVALRYQPGKDAAPVCVAKGSDLLARRIREIARDHEIPVIENRKLARALHAQVEVDDVVPVEHWQAVAEIVGYVIDLRRKILRKPPSGSALRLDD